MSSATTLVSQLGRLRPLASLRLSVGILNPPAAPSSCTSATSHNSHNSHNHHPCYRQQVRFRRHDRHTVPERKPSKKQRRKYNRQLQEQNRTQHGGHHSRAVERAEYVQAVTDEFRRRQSSNRNNTNTALPGDVYTADDALLDDLVGNTSSLSSQPSPTPVHLGRHHKANFNRVADQMASYRASLAQLGSVSPDEAALIQAAELPSDHDISLVVRSFRDKYGTRRAPVGIVKALQHLLQDLQLPIAAFGEQTYTSLLTACRTPAEGRRIFKLMTEHRHPISSYSWTILVDLHAKVADFEGCQAVLDEMLQEGGVVPTLPAFTSLLSACYKVCNDGRISHSIRAQAGALAWTKWQDLRVLGLVPDAMAYGAMLRICAARGHGERALNILEEMQQTQVKPTTLCFTSALRAVARSHAVAVRYERGDSPRHRRREFLTQHHGQMARQIVILAENAEVEQDQGFVAALILCAASAGDMATAKAIHVASQIRQMDQLRTVGSDEHLALLRGEEPHNDHLPGGTLALAGGDGRRLPTEQQQQLQEQQQQHPPPRALGRSPHAAFQEREYGPDTRALSAILHACATATERGLVWQGRENKGLLCDNSLRLLTAKRVPEYRDNSIPGAGVTDALTWEGDYQDVDRKHKLGKRSKFRGVWPDDNVAANLDELDESFARMFVGPDGQLKPEFRKLTADDIWEIKYGERPTENASAPALDQSVAGFLEGAASNEEDETIGSRFEFDRQSLQWKAVDEHEESEATPTAVPQIKESTLYFDYDTMKWETREPAAAEEDESSSFLAGNDDSNETLKSQTALDASEQTSHSMQQVTQAGDIVLDYPAESLREQVEQLAQEQLSLGDLEQLAVQKDHSNMETFEFGELDRIADFHDLDDDSLEESDPELALLEEVLPGFSLKRRRRILSIFKSSLNSPSLIDLVPLVREQMPDYITSTWLKAMASLTSRYVLKEAEQRNLINRDMLNSALQIETASGSLDRALEFYELQFAQHSITPNAYSDRLIIQMFIKNNRFSRALEMKERIEGNGRSIDLASYGSLVEYAAKRGQIGSALLLLQECVRVHESPPKESSVSHLRMLCQKEGIEESSGLTEMIGEDPTAWLKHGEAHLKREMSKKGRRDVLYARNRAIQL